MRRERGKKKKHIKEYYKQLKKRSLGLGGEGLERELIYKPLECSKGSEKIEGDLTTEIKKKKGSKTVIHKIIQDKTKK